MQNRLDGLYEFLAVAEAGSFTTAARRLLTTKSVISDRVRALEDRLGSRLFDRTTRRVHITEAGRIFLAHARRIASEADAAENALQDLSGEPRGLLRVATTVNFAALFIAPLLAEFRRTNPMVDIEILAEEVVRDPAEAGADVAIRFGAIERQSAIARRIAPVHYILCAARSYLDAQGIPEKPSELAGHICLAFRDVAPWSPWRLRRGSEYFELVPRDGVSTRNGIVHRALILAGHGIGMINWLAVADAIADGSIVRLFPDWKLDGFEDMASWVILPDNRAVPPKVRVFVDFIAARMRELTSFHEANSS
ncbi:putative DNA-binding transcriptional regulator [Mesorhizobium sp. ORS 3324]|nr:putative DNA-binding transcriptional regulator [Mesorhizobium sp. ORS 3324]